MINEIYITYRDTPTERGTTWGDAYALIHDAIIEFVPIEDALVPREWYDAHYTTMSKSEAVSAASYWRCEQNSEPLLFTGTLDYFATGEGNTCQLVGGYAYSLGEFILSLNKSVGAYYVRGMTFYNGKPSIGDRVYEMFRTPHLDFMLDNLNQCMVELDLRTYMNCS